MPFPEEIPEDYLRPYSLCAVWICDIHVAMTGQSVHRPQSDLTDCWHPRIVHRYVGLNAGSRGVMQMSYTYEAFGGTNQNGSASTNSYKYTGREDDWTGLYYYPATL
jgi:hypothetical protein